MPHSVTTGSLRPVGACWWVALVALLDGASRTVRSKSSLQGVTRRRYGCCLRAALLDGVSEVCYASVAHRCANGMIQCVTTLTATLQQRKASGL